MPLIWERSPRRPSLWFRVPVKTTFRSSELPEVRLALAVRSQSRVLRAIRVLSGPATPAPRIGVSLRRAGGTTAKARDATLATPRRPECFSGAAQQRAVPAACAVKHQLAILFLVPFYPAQKRHGMSNHLSGWLRQVCDKVPHSAAAWPFLDRSCKTFSAGDDAWPGIVLLARPPK